MQAVAELLTTDKLSELACVTLYMMFEMMIGKKSRWHHYIKELDMLSNKQQFNVEACMVRSVWCMVLSIVALSMLIASNCADNFRMSKARMAKVCTACSTVAQSSTINCTAIKLFETIQQASIRQCEQNLHAHLITLGLICVFVTCFVMLASQVCECALCLTNGKFQLFTCAILLGMPVSNCRASWQI